jgi:hypothetical protein
VSIYLIFCITELISWGLVETWSMYFPVLLDNRFQARAALSHVASLFATPSSYVWPSCWLERMVASDGMVARGLIRQLSTEYIAALTSVGNFTVLVTLVVGYNRLVKRVGVVFTATAGLLISGCGALTAVPDVPDAPPASLTTRLGLGEAS